MIETAYPGPFAPDNPTRRLPWVLALSMLLVLLALLGLGQILNPPAQHPIKPKPLLARIYELPASRGAGAAKPAPTGRHSDSTRSAPRRAQPQHPLVTHAHTKVSTLHIAPPTIAVPAQPSHTRQPIPRPARLSRQPNINWSTLQSQINNAVRQSDPSLPQIHDPHTLVARYYIASVMLKLQRIGDMNATTNLVGMPVLRMVIGAHGELQQLALLSSSGNNELDQDALQIARESAPFAPFPDKLRRESQHIDVVCYMKFEGYQQIYAGE